MRLLIFNTLSFRFGGATATVSPAVVPFPVGSAQGSMSTNSVSGSPARAAVTRLASRHINPIWVACIGVKLEPSGMIARLQPLVKATRGRAAKSLTSSPGSPAWWVKASQLGSGTLRAVTKSEIWVMVEHMAQGGKSDIAAQKCHKKNRKLIKKLTQILKPSFRWLTFLVAKMARNHHLHLFLCLSCYCILK